MCLEKKFGKNFWLLRHSTSHRYYLFYHLLQSSSYPVTADNPGSPLYLFTTRHTVHTVHRNLDSLYILHKNIYCAYCTCKSPPILFIYTVYITTLVYMSITIIILMDNRCTSQTGTCNKMYWKHKIDGRLKKTKNTGQAQYSNETISRSKTFLRRKCF